MAFLVRVCLLHLLLAWPLAAGWAAPPLPPALAKLQTQLEQAQATLANLQQQAQRQRQRHAAAAQQLQAAVRLTLAQQATPSPLQLAHTVLTTQLQPPGLLQALTRHAAIAATQAKPQLAQLQNTYSQLNAQVAQVHTLQAAFQQSQGRLNALEIAVLQRAGTNLAEALSTALTTTGPSPSLGLMADERTLITATTPAKLLQRPRAAAAAAAAQPRSVPAPGRIRAHQGGVRIAAPAGTAIKAGTAGQVLYAGPFKSLNGLVIVETPTGEDVIYANLATLSVMPGDTVNPTHALGTVAEGGLYWEIRRKGRALPPLRWLQAKP